MMKAVIFDLNGVFLGGDLLSTRFEQDFSVKAGDFISALKEIMPIVRKPKAPSCFSLFKPYLKKWGLKFNKPEFFQYWFSGEHPVIELITYARGLKKRKIRVFILSNNFKERTKYYRKHFPDIFAAVDKAYFSWETGFVKPDEKSFRFILQENELKPEECAYFDNDEENVVVAKRIGIRAFLYNGFEETKQFLEIMMNN